MSKTDGHLEENAIRFFNKEIFIASNECCRPTISLVHICSPLEFSVAQYRSTCEPNWSLDYPVTVRHNCKTNEQHDYVIYTQVKLVCAGQMAVWVRIQESVLSFYQNYVVHWQVLGTKAVSFLIATTCL
jgi:hypothetical protein